MDLDVTVEWRDKKEPPSRNRGVGSLDLESPFGLPLSPPVVPPGA